MTKKTWWVEPPDSELTLAKLDPVPEQPTTAPTTFEPDIVDIIKRIGPGKLYSSEIQQVTDELLAQMADAGKIVVDREDIEIAEEYLDQWQSALHARGLDDMAAPVLALRLRLRALLHG